MANELMQNVGGTGLSIKRVAVIGVVGGVTIGVSDYWVNQWWADDTDATSQGRKRAAAQAVVGIGAAYVLKRWSRDAAIGAAAGGIVGAVVRLWDSENMAGKMGEWFDGSSNDAPTNQGNETPARGVYGQAGAVYGERTVIADPRTRRTMRG